MESNYSIANIFNEVKVQSFERHLFNLSHTNSFSCDMGKLYPVLVDDVIPGDRIDCNTSGRVQLMPLATPTMQNMKVYIRYFYVPYRLIWSKWDEFISQDGFSDTPMLAPYTQLNYATLNTMLRNYSSTITEFLGVKFRNVNDKGQVRAFPEGGTRVQFNLFRWLAYTLIWDSYFRDENLQNPITVPADEVLPGYNNHSDFNLINFLPVAYEKDYFTTALPWQQKGQPVTVSSLLTDNKSFPISHKITDWIYGSTPAVPVDIPKSSILNAVINTGDPIHSGSTYTNVQAGFDNTNDPLPNGAYKISSEVNIDKDELGVTFDINQLRYANALQRYLEKMALSGNRPAEFYLSMYGVNVDDLRIGMPKYLGGGYSYIHVTPVKQSAIASESPLGTLAGDGVSTPMIRFNEPYYAKEFGVVLGLLYIRPEINYTQGIDKNVQLFDKLDFYNPEFAHLGEEPVYSSEAVVFDEMDNTQTEYRNDPILGYQSRYAYKKEIRNSVNGDLLTSLSTWILSRNLNPASAPALNSDFITVQQNYNIFAIPEGSDHFICEFHNQYYKESSMPDFAIPTL